MTLEEMLAARDAIAGNVKNLNDQMNQLLKIADSKWTDETSNHLKQLGEAMRIQLVALSKSLHNPQCDKKH